ATSLSVGQTVTKDVPCFPIPVNGTSGPVYFDVTGVTGEADITVCNTGSLVVDTAGAGAIAVATGFGTVRLTSTNGSVSQSGTGGISGSLGVLASTGVILDAVPTGPGGVLNSVFTLAGHTDSGPFQFRARDTGLPVTIGAVSASSCFAGAMGIT